MQDRRSPPRGTDVVRGVSVRRAASVQSPLPGRCLFLLRGVDALGAGSRLALKASPVSDGGEDLPPGIPAQARRLPWLLLITSAHLRAKR